MKKSILALAIAVSLTFSASAQTWPKPQLTKASAAYGKWINMEGVTMKLNKLSPVAIKEAVTEVKELLKLIDADYYSPTVDNSLFYLNETEEDYAKFYVNASIDFSKVEKAWKGLYNGKQYLITLATTKETISICFR
jgi:hypothetical protein